MRKLKRWRTKRKLRKVYDRRTDTPTLSFEEWLDLAIILIEFTNERY